MSETIKHTPGLWHILSGTYPVIESESGLLVAKTDCSMSIGTMVEDNEERQGNARLIAAAPDLLEALCEMVETYEEAESWEKSPRPVIKVAHAAIAKATGGPTP